MARWKWTDKILGKEETFIDDEPDNEYVDDDYVDTPARPVHTEEASPRKTGVISGSGAASLEMKIIKPNCIIFHKLDD